MLYECASLVDTGLNIFIQRVLIIIFFIQYYMLHDAKWRLKQITDIWI